MRLALRREGDVAAFNDTARRRNQRESRDYAQLLYLFDAAPPFAVSRVSAPFTLPSCVQQRLHMRIQVAKTFVAVAGGYMLCWGELDCYSCCTHLSRAAVLGLLQLPSVS